LPQIKQIFGTILQSISYKLGVNLKGTVYIFAVENPDYIKVTL